jgi:drug/metabolite transporter (DMT)-like permease
MTLSFLLNEKVIGDMTARKKAEFYLFLTTFIWGSTFVIGKIGMMDLSPFAFVTVRFSLGSLLFAAVFFRKINRIPASTLKRGLILGVLLGVGIALQNLGLFTTSASNAGFITGMMVIFTPLAQIIFLKKKPKFGNLIGVAVVTYGLYLLTSPGGSHGVNFGDVMVLISSVLFGIYIVFLDVYSKQEDIVKMGFVQILTVAVVSMFFLPFETVRLVFTPASVAILFYLAFFATVVTTYVQNRYQKDTTPTSAVIIFSVEPVISAILAFFVLNEVMGWVGVAGGALIIVGILVSEFAEDIGKKLPWASMSPVSEED